MARGTSPYVGVGGRHHDAIGIGPVVMQALPDAARALRDIGVRRGFERPGTKSVSPAMNCSGVEVVVWWMRIVDMDAPCVEDARPPPGRPSDFGIGRCLDLIDHLRFTASHTP